MVVFDDNQLEIAIITYKRSEFIQAWLDKCYHPANKRNIVISVYDSSPDDNTKSMVEAFNIDKTNVVRYYHVDTNINVGYKPMMPIFNTTAQYLWVAGDSRYNLIDELDENVFQIIKNGSADYIVFNAENNYQIPDTIFYDKEKMIHNTFVASTCVGLSIYRVSIFDVLKNNKNLLEKCDELFKNNYGFGWLGYFYHAYSYGNYKTLLVNAKTLSVLNKQKKQSWAVRFYGCWVDDLCEIIDNIPGSFIGKDEIPKNTWKVMKLDGFRYSYLARKKGDLNRKKYTQMTTDGTIIRITDKPWKIKFYATIPLWMLDICYVCYRLGGRVLRGKKI